MHMANRLGGPLHAHRRGPQAKRRTNIHEVLSLVPEPEERPVQGVHSELSVPPGQVCLVEPGPGAQLQDALHHVFRCRQGDGCRSVDVRYLTDAIVDRPSPFWPGQIHDYTSVDGVLFRFCHQGADVKVGDWGAGKWPEECPVPQFCCYIVSDVWPMVECCRYGTEGKAY